jgi:CRP/FNR family transcriptional regulator, cyclic AMP receptor protein
MENKKVIHSSFWSNFFKPKNYISEIEQLLKSLPPFSELNGKDIHQLCSLLHTRNYLAGEYIFYQGDPGIGLYLIHNGDVEIQRIDESGNTFSWPIFPRETFLVNLHLLMVKKEVLRLYQKQILCCRFYSSRIWMNIF